MNLYEKLLEIQKSVDSFVKDNVVGEGRQSYKVVGSEQVLETVRPLMNEHKLLLIPSVTSAAVSSDKTSSGTTRYFTEIMMVMTWKDVESGEELAVPWYGQGVDLAGEKGVGKANTYAEKYFIMKFFHVPTPKDDPDSDNRTKKGELRQKGTQAARETEAAMRDGITGMLDELCGGDAAKIAQSVAAFTKNDAAGYAGVNSVGDISGAALPLIYGRVKLVYADKTGRQWTGGGGQ